MKRCSRCLLPETYPNIRYNEEGVCNYCLSYTPVEYKGEEKLEELLGFYRDRGVKYDYDCVVGVSGGRDSTSKKFSPGMVPALCLGCRYGIAGGVCKVAMRWQSIKNIGKAGIKLYRGSCHARDNKFS